MGPQAKIPSGYVDAEDLSLRLCSTAIFLSLLITIFFRPFIPSTAVFAVAFTCSLLGFILRFDVSSFKCDLSLPFLILFEAVGLLYIAASALHMFAVDSALPLRDEFIVRHSYYLLVWLPMIAGSTALFRQAAPLVISWIRSFGTHLVLLLALSDVVLAFVFGDRDSAFDGYTSFLDAPPSVFVYSSVLLISVSVNKRPLALISIVSAHFILSRNLGLGIIFNTLTGIYVFATFLMYCALLKKSCIAASWGAAGVFGALMCTLLLGAIFPDLATSDLNTFWRFQVWRENLSTLLDSGLIGIGFGTPYYRVSPESISVAYRLVGTPDFSVYAGTSPLDILYVRGQHSSFINAFYRMGIVGGSILIFLTISVFLDTLRSANRRSGDMQCYASACSAIFLIETAQIGMHVGLESPRYFVLYVLALGMARGCVHSDGERQC
jgi:hypothetical protein